MKKVDSRELDIQTLQAVQKAYHKILAASGYGTIRIRIERAGASKESHFVGLEIEQKTK